MTCADARMQLLDATRGRLERGAAEAVSAHVEHCAACAQAKAAERALDDALARGLPRSTAPASLKRRLALMAGPARPRRRGAGARTRSLAPWLGVAASIALVLGAAIWWRGRPAAGSDAPLVAELVNDHLRVLARERPVDVESHGTHEVKPWFEGRLDFAPDVPAPPVPDLQLRGGAVGYVFDQKAAVVLYALRRHAVTLVVTRGATAGVGLGAAGFPSMHHGNLRGFHVAWWRAGDLVYALVSDANAEEVAALAAAFAAETDPDGTR